MNAIVYTSNTGFTEKYARMLGERTGLPVFSMKEGKPDKGAEVIYLGWLMAGSVKGLRRAAKRWNVQAVCAVGMAAPTLAQQGETKKACSLPENVPVFLLQGGYNYQRLRGFYRLMMAAFQGAMRKQLEKKERLTPEEADSLDLLRHGGDRVTPAALEPVLAWLNAR